MRRAAAAALVAGLLSTAPAAAHPGHSNPTVAISSFAFTPQTLNVVVNDTVVWSWPTTPDTNHSVTADAGSGAQFDSDPGRQPSHPPGDFFVYQFTKAGTYTYHCKVHASMTGTIVVSPPPPGTPPPDTKAPIVTAPGARMERRCARHTPACARRVLRVRFTVDERSDITIAIKRRGARSVRRVVFTTVRRGRAAVAVSTSGFARGRYVASVTATDAVGNQSKTRSAGFSL